jgi:hypothetical protein
MSGLITAAIALIGVYIAFSLLTSWLNEQFATFIGLRSKTLVAGMRTMIGDAATTEVFGHPLIASLCEPQTEGPRQKLAAIFEPLVSKFTEKVVGVHYASGTSPSASASSGSAATNRLPTYISSTAFATVVTDIVRGHGTATTDSSSAAKLGAGWSDLVAGIDAVGANPELAPLHEAIAPIWREAQGDYDTFVRAVATWYDIHNDRVRGWYKRSAQLILLWIAVLTVVALNIDTLQIWSGFQTNVTAANAVAGIAQAYANSNAANLTGGVSANPTKPQVPSQPCVMQGAGAQSTCTCPPGFIANAAGNGCVPDLTTFTQLPLGWGSAYRGPFAPSAKPAEFWKNFFAKLLGWAVTVAALMLGAPFWFDLLGSIVNVRSAGPPPPTVVPKSSS